MKRSLTSRIEDLPAAFGPISSHTQNDYGLARGHEP
jgi:hypothetical protein